MELKDLARIIPGISTLPHADQIKAYAWYLHQHKAMERFSQADIRGCYDRLHYQQPSNISPYFTRLLQKHRPELLKDKGGYRLAGHIREAYDAKFGSRPETLAVDALLAGLPGQVSDEAERLFLTEAIKCFQVRAFRATIVMMWNLAYDHFLQWVVDNHVAAFNTCVAATHTKKQRATIKTKEDFGGNFREFEVIELSKTAGFLHDNVKKILTDKLTKRNMAAHPSLIEFTQFQAEEAISDLVTNVILKLRCPLQLQSRKRRVLTRFYPHFKTDGNFG